MFHEMSRRLKARMEWLERQDAADRLDGTPRRYRLRQVPRETGRFLAILAATAPAGDVIEVGTSGGYSTLWLALGCIETNRQVTTFEVASDKVDMARETFRMAGVTESVRLERGDARELLAKHEQIAFCFLDAEKQDYETCYDLIVPRLVPGGLFVADNAISHREVLGTLVERALGDQRVDAVVVPIGKGQLLCRKIRH